ncbi:macrophage mannose receptor 1-like [Trachinotus anak]|uniref:macrophage mannose receptor 1-like n=1 Tax=Trachinotus anak TaxID=443729 RepID=UPI0039F1DA5E
MHPEIPLTLCEVEVYSTWEHPQNTFPQQPLTYNYSSSSSTWSRDLILVHNQPKTWFEGQTYCREKYADLATISNVKDMNKVIDFINQDVSNLWIGLYEDGVIWRWSLSDKRYYADGEDKFRNWDSGEPDTKRGIQHCAGMQRTGEWKDLDCGLLNFFLCFDDRDGASENKILVETPMKWADAQHYCRQNHKDLLSVRNLAENQEFQSMVPAGKLAWIGLFGDSWKWSDASDSLFRYWGQGQLDNLGEGPNCAYANGRTWSVRSCNTKSMFLCYYFKRRYLVRISTDFDMSDPVIQQQLIKQLEAGMKSKGNSDVKIQWRMSGRSEK